MMFVTFLVVRPSIVCFVVVSQKQIKIDW